MRDFIFVVFVLFQRYLILRLGVLCMKSENLRVPSECFLLEFKHL